ncbi:MAG: YfhO family protein [Thermoleophilaceae bacterium]|nr:YfhO family protein [Thermoleophilaceae bacterium]
MASTRAAPPRVRQRTGTRAESARRLGPALLFVVLAVLLFAPATLGGKILSAGDQILFSPPFTALERPGAAPSNDALSDSFWVFQPDQLEVRDALRSFELPAWTRSQAAGRPLLASQQSAPLFPLNWISSVLPYWESLAWVAVLKLALAALGAFALARALGYGTAPALLAGLSFGFGMYLIVWLAHPHANAYALLPWLFLAAERLCRRGGVADAGLLALAVGLAWLGGHPQSALIVTLPAVAWTAVRLRGPGEGSIGRRARLAAMAGVVGIGLAAVMLAPFLEALGQSNDTSRGGGVPLEPRALLAFVFPEYWHRPEVNFQLSLEGPSAFPERTAYFGALPLMLALAGLVRRRPSGPQLFFAGLAAVALVTAVDAGPLTDAIRELPVLSKVELNRVLVLAAFAGAMLAAAGLQALLTGTAEERRRMLKAAAVLAVLPPLVWLVASPSRAGDLGGTLRAVLDGGSELGSEQVALWSVVRWTAVAAAGIAVIAALTFRPGAARAAAVSALGLVAVDLLVMAAGYQPARDRRYVVPDPPPAIAAMRSLTADGGRVAGHENALGPNLAGRFGLADARGWEHPVIERYVRLWTALGGASGDTGPQRSIVDAAAPGTPRLLDVFGVTAVLSPELAERGYPVEYQGPDGVVVGNPTAFPRAFVAYGWRPSGSLDESLFATASRGADVRRRPVVEDAPDPPRGAPPEPTVAEVREESDTDVFVTVRAKQRGQLILLDTYYPGWRATVDGRPAEIRPANTAFRAVSVPAGEHLVRFTYGPASVAGGLMLSVASLLLIAAAIFLGRRRRSATQ